MPLPNSASKSPISATRLQPSSPPCHPSGQSPGRGKEASHRSRQVDPSCSITHSCLPSSATTTLSNSGGKVVRYFWKDLSPSSLPNACSEEAESMISWLWKRMRVLNIFDSEEENVSKAKTVSLFILYVHVWLLLLWYPFLYDTLLQTIYLWFRPCCYIAYGLWWRFWGIPATGRVGCGLRFFLGTRSPWNRGSHETRKINETMCQEWNTN